MFIKRKKISLTRKILIAIIALVLIAGIAFQVFIHKYLPPVLKERLSKIIVEGSDSLYKFELEKFDVNFWGGGVYFSNLHISIDSNRYQQMKDAGSLPPLTMDLQLPKARIKDLSFWKLIFSKKIDISEINLLSADLKLARHFKTTDTLNSTGTPLWKLIQPAIQSVSIQLISCADLNMSYQNIDSAKSFRWQFNKCNIAIEKVLVDSLSANDSTRMLFAKNIALAASNVKLKTPDGLYQLAADDIKYISSSRSILLNTFSFLPVVTDQQFKKHFGYQHEIYRLKASSVRLSNFLLPRWFSNNSIQADTLIIASPAISLSLDRNMPPNKISKNGKFPHQLLQKAPFTISVKRIKIKDATLNYTETSNLTGLTGNVVFPHLNGTIDNVTNDPAAIELSSECIARINGQILKTGTIQAVFRFSLPDKNGAFDVQSTITNLNAAQLQPLFLAMTATDMQSFNLKRIDYTMHGDRNKGTGNLQMKYDDMDILINKVGPDKSMDQKGLLSFFANRLLIHKENPSKDGEERKAENVVVQRDDTKSFFNLVWKTLFNAAGEIVLRPVAKRKIEKRNLQKK